MTKYAIKLNNGEFLRGDMDENFPIQIFDTDVLAEDSATKAELDFYDIVEVKLEIVEPGPLLNDTALEQDHQEQTRKTTIDIETNRY